MRPLPLLKSKRGVALESAILFMTVIFSFCFILTSLALIGRNRARLDTLYVQSYVESEQIGEYFVIYLEALGDSTPDNITEDGFKSALPQDFRQSLPESYSISVEAVEAVEADGTYYALTVSDGDRAVLYIKANLNGDAVELISWRRTAPENTES